MSSDLKQDHSYKTHIEKLIAKLIEKTHEGKIQWQETAREGTFLAAVPGEQTFEISRTDSRVRLVCRYGGEGNVSFQFETQSDEAALELHDLARGIALRLEERERIDRSLELLNRL